MGLGKRSLKIPQQELIITPLGEIDGLRKLLRMAKPNAKTKLRLSWSCKWLRLGNTVRSSEQEGAEPDPFAQEVCRETSLEKTNVTNEEYVDAMWKSFGKTAPFAATSFQKKDEDADRD